MQYKGLMYLKQIFKYSKLPSNFHRKTNTTATMFGALHIREEEIVSKVPISIVCSTEVDTQGGPEFALEESPSFHLHLNRSFWMPTCIPALGFFRSPAYLSHHQHRNKERLLHIKWRYLKMLMSLIECTCSFKSVKLP